MTLLEPITVNSKEYILHDGQWYELVTDQELIKGLESIKKIDDDLQPLKEAIKNWKL